MNLKIRIGLQTLLVLASFLIGSLALAVDLGDKANGLAQQVGGQGGYDISATTDTLPQTIGRVVKIALAFVGTIFFVLCVYAGFLWMTAQGNTEQVKKATDIFRTSIIGMIIIVAAYSITYWTMIFVANSTAGVAVGK